MSANPATCLREPIDFTQFSHMTVDDALKDFTVNTVHREKAVSYWKTPWMSKDEAKGILEQCPNEVEEVRIHLWNKLLSEKQVENKKNEWRISKRIIELLPTNRIDRLKVSLLASLFTCNLIYFLKSKGGEKS